jgi:hypothetical protein
MASLGRIENIPNKQKSLGRIWQDIAGLVKDHVT